MTAPSVGRIVHYASTAGECQAAIVTEVGDGDTVGLTVFEPYQAVQHHLSLGGVVYDESPSARGAWHWPERA